MLIAYLDRLSKSGQDSVSELEDLEEFYQASRRLFDNDESFANIAREYVVKLQAGDEDIRAVWKRFVEASLQHCEQVYRRLDVTLRREDVRAESTYNDDLPNILECLRKKICYVNRTELNAFFLRSLKIKKVR